MSAEFGLRYGPALIINLGASFGFLEGNAWMVLRPSFLVMHFSGVEGSFSRSYRYGGLCCNVLDLEGTPARLAIHIRLIIGFDYLACSSRCQV